MNNFVLGNHSQKSDILHALLACLLFVSGAFFPSLLQGQAFPAGNIYIAGSVDAQVYEYSPSLTLVSSWGHPSFGTAGQAFSNGPEGMVFDPAGNLVVAARDSFCVFSAPGVVANCYPKVQAEPTENIIYDNLGNIYTTTSSQVGSNRVHKYDLNFNFVNTFVLPSGQLTGITCDNQGRLYIVSLSCSGCSNCSCIYVVDGTSFAVLDVITNIPNIVDDIQYTNSGNLLITRFGLSNGTSSITRIQDSSPYTVIADYSLPIGAGTSFANTVTIDNNANIYVSDFNSGSGQSQGDFYILDSLGNVTNSITPGAFRGPWGTAVAGVNLPCGANNVIVPTLSQWALIIFGLLVLCLGAIGILRYRRKGSPTKP